MMGGSTGQGSVAPGEILVTLGDMGMMHTAFFINLSTATAPAGRVTFVVQNQGSRTHELVVLQTDTPASDIPITSFEGEPDRINEDSAGTNVGETGDMAPGQTKRVTLQLAQGHYALVCNLPGHYRAGMRRDFVVT